MKRAYILLLLACLLAIAASAQTTNCTASNSATGKSNDPALAKSGHVTYDSNSYDDYCETELGGTEDTQGQYIREYYCSGGVMGSKEYDCKKLGYDGCKNGACY